MNATLARDFETEFAAWEPVFADYRSVLRVRHKTDKPQKIYSRVEKFWDWLRANEILPQELRARDFVRFATELESGSLCKETKGYSRQSLTIFLNHALAWTRYLSSKGRLLRDPFEGFSAGKFERKVFTSALAKEDVFQILQAPDLSVPWGVRNQAILEVIYGSGLRIGEAASLTLESLDLGERTVSLRNTKNGWDRTVPLTRSGLRSLVRYITEARPAMQGAKTGSALWLSYHHGVLTKDTFTGLAGHYSRQLGIDFTMHGLRHACATHLLEGGASLRHIAELLGHENLESTSYYAKARVEELRKVHQRTHPRG